MIARILLLCVLSLCSTRIVCGQNAPAAADQTALPTSDNLRTLIEKSRAEWDVPGLSVAVVHQGEVVLSAGFGLREQGQPEPVDGSTVFAIASNTKAFTAAAVAMLQESGKLQWQDRVQQHLPWLQVADSWVSHELRIDDLLCHRSGLGTFSGDLLWWGTPYTPQQVLQRARHLPLKNRFRAEYGYSNLMFLAAGEVIRTASGQTWQQFIAERILQPLQMQRTVLSVKDLAALGNAARPHKTMLTGNQPIDWFNWDTMAAAGGIISCSDDMAKWLQLQLRRGQLPNGERLFSEASSHRMWTPHTIIPVSRAAQTRIPSTHFRSCGLGWMLADYRGRMTVGHGGGYDGM
jgi:CubicO group peptidase (beta-lactamase class C family)